MIVYLCEYTINRGIVYVKWANHILLKLLKKDFQVVTLDICIYKFYTCTPLVLCTLCVCVLSHVSYVQLFAMLWTATHQTPLSMGILQTRILEWIAIALLQRIFPTQRLNLHLLRFLRW